MRKFTQFISSLFAPFRKRDELYRSKDFIQRLINSETDDLRKMALTKIKNNISVFDFKDSSMAAFIAELHRIQNEHLHDCNSFKIHLKRYLDFVLLEDKSTEIMQMVEKKELAEERLKLNQLYYDHPELLKDDTHSVQADIIAKKLQGEVLKAEDHLKMVEMAGTPIHIAYKENVRLRELASENPKKALKELESLQQEVKAPTYPSATEINLEPQGSADHTIEPETSKTEAVAVDKKLERSEKVVSPAESVSNYARKVMFTKPIDEYTLLSSHLEKQMAFGIRFEEIYNEEETKSEDDIQLEHDTSQAIHIPTVKESSVLANVSTKTTFIVNAISILATIPELVIMAKAVAFIFRIDEETDWEFWFMGLAFPLFAKLNSVLLIQPILNYFKRNGQLFRIKNFAVNRLAFAVFLLSFVYCIGISNLFLQLSNNEQLTKKFVLLKKEYVSVKKEAGSEDTPPPVSVQQDLKDNEEQLKHLKGKVFTINEEPSLLQKLVVSCTMAVTLLCSSLLTSIGFVMGRSLYLRRKLETTAGKITHLQELFDTHKTNLGQFRLKTHRIIRYYFELEYLNRLSDNGLTPDKTIHKTRNEEESILPLNGSRFSNHHHNNPTY
ncbi:hypothetical protein H9Q08_17145 [Chryseobacterium sp. PS-8]|uniref:Uncharacterized protein n=1 Tax=Chryseobacterium indicum TaxID=2766954 RepID=A0ABS9C8X4_9FLAO|nr:hypothetical protein [Chryseobacterium sp. PS-8]MCF2221014.1 hypothetical protein [Chryseobacterium sp. PS-8]